MLQVQHGFERQKIQLLILDSDSFFFMITVRVQVRRNKRNTSTGSGLFAFLGSGFAQIIGQIIISKRVKTLEIQIL